MDTEERLLDGQYIFGSEFGVRFSTESINVATGATLYNAGWNNGLGEGNVGNRLVTQAELNYILAFFRARKGRAGRFRVRDQGNYNCTTTQSLASPTQGVGGPTYQTYKRWTSGGTFEDQKLVKLTGTFSPFRNAAPVTAGAGAGQYSIDSNSGIFTFVADASSSASSHIVGATHQVALGSNLGLAIGGKLWLDGVTGTAASVLNNKAHTITNLVGNVFTLNITTTGLAATGGTGRKYPQATDAITFSTDFDLPVHFGVDSMRYRFDAYDSATNERLFFIESLPLVEDR